MNILFLDIETVGLDPSCNSIIEISGLFYANGVLTKEYHAKAFTPNTKVDLGALTVNKQTIKNLMITGNEKQEAQMLYEFVDFSLELPRDTVICGHNVNFDINFIKGRLALNSIDGFNSLFSYRVLDTATIGLFLQSAGELKVDKVSLNKLAQALGISFNEDNLHGAKYDTELTAKVFYEMQKLVKENR